MGGLDKMRTTINLRRKTGHIELRRPRMREGLFCPKCAEMDDSFFMIIDGN